MPILEWYFNFNKIPYYKAHILDKGQLISTKIIKKEGKDKFFWMNNAFILPSPDFDCFFWLDRFATYILYDIENAFPLEKENIETYNSEIDKLNEKIKKDKNKFSEVERKVLPMKKLYRSTNPTLLKRILEEDLSEKIIKPEKSFWEEIKPLILIGFTFSLFVIGIYYSLGIGK